MKADNGAFLCWTLGVAIFVPFDPEVSAKVVKVLVVWLGRNFYADTSSADLLSVDLQIRRFVHLLYQASDCFFASLHGRSTRAQVRTLQ